MKQLREAFEHVFRELVAHGHMPHDQCMLEAMWRQFLSDMSRDVFQSKLEH